MINRGTHSHMRRAAGVASLLLLSLYSSALFAQPRLTLSRVYQQGQNIEFTVNAGCDPTVELYRLQPDRLIVTENGRPITNLSLQCPDSANDCGVTTALVFDAGVAMQGTKKIGTILGGQTFVGHMDGFQNMASVVFYSSFATVVDTLMKFQQTLYDGVSSLTADGSSSNIWDGAYLGIQSLGWPDRHPCKSMILLASGGTDFSAHTYQQVLHYAQEQHVRVFTVNLGAQHLAAELQDLAQKTGGLYYYVLDPADLSKIYSDIFVLLATYPTGCVVNYAATCSDGTQRVVDVAYTGLCVSDDTARASFSFTIPLDTLQLPAKPLELELGKPLTHENFKVRVPIYVRSPQILGLAATFNAFQIGYDPEKLTFVGMEKPLGALEEAMTFTASLLPGIVEVQVSGGRIDEGPGVLRELVFTTALTPDSIFTPLHFLPWNYEWGCAHVSFTDGGVRILPTWRLITTSGSFTQICVPDTITLTASEYFVSCDWSTNETTRSIKVTQGGDYYFTGRDDHGEPVTLPMHFVEHPRPQPTVTPSDDWYVCGGDEVQLTASPGYAAYRWSNGSTSRIIKAVAPGVYTCEVTDDFGCTGLTLPVTLHAAPRPDIQITGPFVVCDTHAATYSVNLGSGWYIDWEPTGGWEASPNNQPTYSLYWNKNDSVHTLALQVTDLTTHCTWDTAVAVTVAPITVRPQIFSTNFITFCPGDSVMLDVGGPFVHYQWSNGATGRRIVLRSAGRYTVKGFNTAGCESVSDTVTVAELQAPARPLLGGLHTLCTGDTLTLDAGQSAINYVWSTGQTTRKIAVTTSGTYYVKVLSPEGCEATSDSATVTAVAAAAKPVITRLPSGELRSSTVAIAYTWYRDGVAIQSGTDNQLVPPGPGSYTVMVIDTNQCEAISDPFDILSAERIPSATEAFTVYPNPFDNRIEVSGTLRIPGQVAIVVYDLLGKERLRLSDRASTGSYRRALDMSALQQGIYIIQITTATGTNVKRIVKRR